MTEQELWKFWEARECVDNVRELNKGRFLPFIGAGMSVNFGYPTWPVFLQSVIEKYASLSEQARLCEMLAKQAFYSWQKRLTRIYKTGLRETVRQYFLPSKMKRWNQPKTM